MGCWSPLDAMNAYVRTLQLCKEYSNNTTTTSKLLEPECIEFISALAAGNRAQLMVDVTSDGSSSSALALAVAARCTGGRLVCVCHDIEALEQTKSQIEEFELGDVVSFRVGVDACEVVKQYKNIDFAVVDHRIKDCDELLFAMDMNTGMSVVVLSNLCSGRRRVGAASSVHARKCRGGGIESAILPVGGGMEVTRIGKSISSRSRGSKKSTSKRTFLVYEE